MPVSYFRGTRSGGIIPPRFWPIAASSSRHWLRTGGFTVNPSRLRVNGFTVNGFISPVDALGHVHCGNPFRIRRYKKCACKCPGIRSYKNKGLKLPWNQ